MTTIYFTWLATIATASNPMPRAAAASTIAALNSATPTGGLQAQTSESIDFIGFSRNQTLAAWRLQIDAAHGADTIDRYALVVVHQMPEFGVGGAPLATFRASPIKRLDGRGKRLRMGASKLHADNPRYAEARSRKLWTSLRRRAKFEKKALVFSDSVLRLQPDQDGSLEARTTGTRIEFRAPPATPVGFAAIVRDWAGKLFSVGHFAAACPEASQIKGNLQGYISRDGFSLAVVATFEVQGEDSTQLVPQISLSRLGQAPVATNGIGAMNSIGQTLRTGASLFNSTLPGVEKHYRRLVGDRISFQRTW